MLLRRILSGAVAILGWACTGHPPASADGVVDSAIPRVEAVRRFRLDLPVVTAFSGGAPTRDKLVRGFLSALERRDTNALRAMTLTKAEFAYLYYPSSPQSLPPYDLSPDLMWFMQGLQGDEGIRHTMDEFGGRRLPMISYECPTEPSRQGKNTVWAPCLVRWTGPNGRAETGRFFGPIVQREGILKFASYSSGRD